MKSFGSSFFLFQLYSCPPLAFLAVPEVVAGFEAAAAAGLSVAVFAVAGAAVSTFGYLLSAQFKNSVFLMA